VFLMEIISWNVRGLGSREKRKEVNNLVREKNPSILCLQETKLTVCVELFCASLWGDAAVSFSYCPFEGASGGLVIMWDCSAVEVWSTVSFEHVVVIHG